jgi:hypothetical protein
MYSYEIHLCAEVRRKGLGKFLMQILELIGHKYVRTYTWASGKRTYYVIVVSPQLLFNLSLRTSIVISGTKKHIGHIYNYVDWATFSNILALSK